MRMKREGTENSWESLALREILISASDGYTSVEVRRDLNGSSLSNPELIAAGIDGHRRAQHDDDYSSLLMQMTVTID
jgi:hypothetical protein